MILRDWKMKQIDMSSEAVTRRLRRSSDLRDLCVSLRNAKRLTDKNRQVRALASGPNERGSVKSEADPR